MKLLITKKNIVFLIAAIIVFAAALGIGTSVAAASAHGGERTVVIDAGHGGIDAGVLGIKTSVKESEINLSISKYLRGYFVDAGFNVVMTRSTQSGLYGVNSKGFKMRDMKKRKQIIEDCNADMVISIHQNSCPIPSKRGGTAFFDKSSESGKALAEAIQAELNGLEECVKKNSALAGDYYMLKCTDNPSVIVECGFLTNAEDDKLLNSEEYRDKVAYAVFKGAISCFA